MIQMMKALFVAFAFALLAGPLFATPESAPWWPESVSTAIAQSGSNRFELTKALNKTPEAQREGMQFLIENMPERDLQNLSADYLLENTALAYQAAVEAPWGKRLPQAIFLNDVLPYASLNERRDDWRKKIREIALPLVKGSSTPGEAAQALNRQIFQIVHVRYSTERKKPDQSALESMESGLATCSGLSILLVDACRACGVPARVAGTPMWKNMRGNHTWVEVWDDGWHFVGAAEPDGKGLDHGWFNGDAAQAIRDVPQHAIYASSFRKTGLAFPLVWDFSIQWVPAVNVTDRYAAGEHAVTTDGEVRLLVRVFDGKTKHRVAAKVTVADDAGTTVQLEGMSRDESADLNNILSFNLPRNRGYRIKVENDGKIAEQDVKTADGNEAEQIVEISLGS